MYSRPSSWACSMKGALVVVRPLPAAYSARTPDIGSPLLLFVPPGCDSASLGLGLDRLRLCGLQRWHLDFLVGHYGSRAVQELEDKGVRLGRNRLALRGLCLATGCRPGNGCRIGCRR